VLLLWPDQLQVALSAQGAAAISLAAGSGKKKLKQQFVPAIQNVEAPNWHSASTSLEALLSTMQVKPNTQLTIVLNSDFIRYQLLPAQQISMSSAEKQAYAAAAYKEIYGSEIDGWRIKLHETGFSQVSIAAAVDERFLDKLQQVSQQHQIQLVSVQPYLMGAYNSCKKWLSKLSGYFLVIESNKLILLNLQQGRCQNLRMSAVGNDWQQDIKQLLLREAMLNDANGQEVLVYAPVHKQVVINKIEGWHISRIGPTAKLTMTNTHFAMLEVLA
jgi:hypothetical protein